ncbi:MAG TPA: hypothetical protein VK466_12755 [Terriglobales bacterium]|nr:hypothetical protein [Terriglobales bacterium]
MHKLAAALVLVVPALALGQTGVRGVPGYCAYNCGPYVPLITTPIISLQTASANPAGASNATGGLQAGARNSTLQMMWGDTDAVYTQSVWVSGGGSPLVSPAVRLPHPEPMMGMHTEHMMHMEHGHGEEAHQVWTYYAGRAQTASPVEAATLAKSGKHAARTYTNQDVERVGQISQDFKRK